jgi:hypothetical protein
MTGSAGLTVRVVVTSTAGAEPAKNSGNTMPPRQAATFHCELREVFGWFRIFI